MTEGPSVVVLLGAKGLEGGVWPEEEEMCPPPPLPTGELGADGKPVIRGGRMPIGCCAV
jgi:hypothetical protein